jgi:hypothetical protein
MNRSEHTEVSTYNINLFGWIRYYELPGKYLCTYQRKSSLHTAPYGGFAEKGHALNRQSQGLMATLCNVDYLICASTCKTRPPESKQLAELSIACICDRYSRFEFKINVLIWPKGSIKQIQCSTWTLDPEGDIFN